jgi:cytochrome c oxidase subunit 2
MNWALTIANLGRPLPEAASENAASTDWMFLFIWYLSAFFFVLIIALMLFFAFRYRRKHPEQEATGTATHSTFLELAWGLPPLFIVIFIFWVSLGGYMQFSVPMANAKRIDVRAWRWAWEFTYQLPEGGTYGDPQLHIPVDTPIELVMTSDDVIHSLFIPAFRIKKDTVPGKYNRIWFKADKPGTYDLYCTEYCGTSHSAMLSTVVVHEAGGYEKWLAEASRAAFAELDDERYAEWLKIDSAEAHDQFVEKLNVSGDEALVKIAEKLKPAFIEGEALYKKKGCSQCHSLDGTPGSGPSWKGLWGKTRVFQDGGEAVADENYLTEAILYPKKHVVSGYNNVMPEYPGDPQEVRTKREVDAIIQFIRSLDE